MKIVVIGGSSQSTPALIAYLARQTNLPDLRIHLLGRAPSKLSAVRRAARVLAEPSGMVIEAVQFLEREIHAALEGANLVLVQIRPGGYAGRVFDETFPLRYGVCGDEGLGPSGLSAAWRNWPEVAWWLNRINQAAPGAFVVLLTSPTTILVMAAEHCFPKLRVVGICELPRTTLLDIFQTLGATEASATFDYFGVNHLGWFSRISAGTRDLIGEYAAQLGDSKVFPTARQIVSCQGIPLKYLRLHYDAGEVLKEQRAARRSRGEILEELGAEAFAVFANGTRREMEAVLKRRPAPWYTHAVGPLILALTGRVTGIPFFLSVPNRGFLADFLDDDILECAHQVTGEGLTRIPNQRPIPSNMVALTKALVGFHRLASSAVTSRDPLALKTALLAHPWTTDAGSAAEMAREIIDFEVVRDRASSGQKRGEPGEPGRP
jgi:6-phospho-beta-glucosidase